MYQNSIACHVTNVFICILCIIVIFCIHAHYNYITLVGQCDHLVLL